MSEAEEVAPPTPSEPWRVPADLLARSEAALEEVPPPAVDRDRRYDLPALIDLAQRLDPQTRLAWETARQTAAGIDTAKAAYFPQVGAGLVAGAGTSDVRLDLPAGGQTTVDNEAAGVVPAVFAEWLLFDFGERQAAVALARNLALSENLAFNLAHQRTVLAVSRAYHALASARAQAAAARKALGNSRQILAAAEARRERGVGNAIEVAQARQALARARLGEVRATGTERTATVALLDAVGLPPTERLAIDTAPRPLPEGTGERLDRMIRKALRHRPDVLQAVVALDASRAREAGTRAAFRPKVAVVGSLARTDDGLSLGGVGFDLPSTDTAALLTVSFPIFDGGLRESRTKAAEAGVAAARAELRAVRDAAASEVVTAYETLRTALAAWESASALVASSRETAEATLAAYRQGVGSLTDALAAQNVLLDAEQVRAQSRADAHVSATALAFATGSLGRTPAR